MSFMISGYSLLQLRPVLPPANLTFPSIPWKHWPLRLYQSGPFKASLPDTCTLQCPQAQLTSHDPPADTQQPCTVIFKHIFVLKILSRDFPSGAVVKNPPANARDTGSSPGSGRSHVPQSK